MKRKASAVTFIVLDLRGQPGVWGVGVSILRDIYTAFWKEVSDGMLIGEGEKVTFLKHNIFMQEWKAIAKILLKGCKIIPTHPILII